MEITLELKNQKNNSMEKGIVKKIELKDYEAVVALEKKNLAIQEDEYQCMEIDDFEAKRSLKNDTGISYGCYVNGELIGYNTLCLSFEDDVETNCIGLSDEEFEENAVFWSVSHVHSDYRGNGLQKKIVDVCFEAIKKIKPNVKHVFAVVHPDNYPSVLSMLKEGFVFVDMINIKDVYFRYETYKNLLTEFKSFDGKRIEVKPKDFETQVKLFNEGYYLVDYKKSVNSELVFYMEKGGF